MNNDVITCELTSSLTCTTGNPATSNAITMVVNTSLPVSVNIVADNNPTCAGTTVNYTATPTNGGTTPVYQWKKNGSNVGSNSATYSYVPVNNDVVTCVLTSSLTCVTNNPATSNAITMVVNSLPLANAGTDQTISYGSSTTLNDSATSGSGSYTWHWEPANLLVNPDSQYPTTINLISSVQFTLTVIDAVFGCIGLDDLMLVTVTGGPFSLDVTATPSTVCAGSLVQLMAIPGGGTGNYTYTWTSDPSGFTSSLQNPIDYPIIFTTYTVVVSDGNSTLSDFVMVTVNPLPPVPDMPTGPDMVDLYTTATSDYGVNPLANTDYYLWVLEPLNMGSIAGNGTNITIIWSGSLGQANLSVKAVNTCGEGVLSETLAIQVDNTVGFDEVSKHEVTIAPNPGKGRITVSSTVIITAISIYDVSGNRIHVNEITPGYQVTLQPGLKQGLYFISVFSNTQYSTHKLIIVP